MPLYAKPRFQHELEWYGYYYEPVHKRVCFYHKTLEPCRLYFFTREALLQEIEQHKWNIFLLPIYRQALTYFPQGENHETQQVRPSCAQEHG